MDCPQGFGRFFFSITYFGVCVFNVVLSFYEYLSGFFGCFFGCFCVPAIEHFHTSALITPSCHMSKNKMDVKQSEDPSHMGQILSARLRSVFALGCFCPVGLLYFCER